MKNLQSLFPEIILSGDAPLVIAGPCSAETRQQTLSVAEKLARGGVKIFRAGVWKPRTRPGGFEGVGEPALKWVQGVQQQTGMRVVTEVAKPEHLRAVLEAELAGVWLGARTAANPFAVQELADAFAALTDEERNSLAVLVKNPVSPDLELWVGALQRLYGAGVRRLGAIHRGFSYYSHGRGSYRNAPYWAIPFELRRRFPSLPLIFDPSHTGGSREFIAPLSREALDMGFDGLIVEVHETPEIALSDSSQQLTPSEFFESVASLRRGVEDSAEESLKILREEIDSLDGQLLELLGRRMEVSRRIGRVKQESGLSVVQPSRYARLINERTETGSTLGLTTEFVHRVFAAIHEESVRNQLREE